MDLEFDIFVVANPHRSPLVAPYLKDLEAYIHITPDYTVPKNWKSHKDWQYIYKAHGLKGANGHLRCNTGHQDCLKKMKKSYALMLEDDAVPNRKDWLDVVKSSIGLLEKYEIVSLHGRLLRNKQWDEFRHNNMVFLKPNVIQKDVFCCGSLGYLISKSSANKMIQFPFTGMPQDMTICKKFTFCVIKNSPFDHNRKQGSLIE